MQTSIQSGWQDTLTYNSYLNVIWNDNLTFLKKVNDSRDPIGVLKALSDYYYGLISLKKSIIFFIESETEQKERIDIYLRQIKELTHDQEIIQCRFEWEHIYKIRNILISFDEDLFRVMGKCRLLTPLVVKKTYDDLHEEINEENV